MRPRRQAVVLTALVAAAALLAGCSDEQLAGAPTLPNSTDSTVSVASDAEPALPVTLVDDTGTEVTINSIDRIVPVDGDLTEIVYALGLGDHVVATDISATYPPEVAEVPDIGYQRALNAEPIAAMAPTVVLATDLAGPPEVLEQLRQVNVPVVLIERQPTLAGPAAKIQDVADALGVPERGRQLAAAVSAEIEEAATDANAALAAMTAPPRMLPLYLRGDNVQLILGEGTGIDAVLDGIGVVDVAAEMGVVDTRQITAEALLLAAPDVPLVTTTGLESVGGIEGLLAIPGLAATPAGQARRVLAYEDQYLLGNGPRTGQLMRQLIADLQTLQTLPTASRSASPSTSPSTNP